MYLVRIILHKNAKTYRLRVRTPFNRNVELGVPDIKIPESRGLSHGIRAYAERLDARLLTLCDWQNELFARVQAVFELVENDYPYLLSDREKALYSDQFWELTEDIKSAKDLWVRAEHALISNPIFERQSDREKNRLRRAVEIYSRWHRKKYHRPENTYVYQHHISYTSAVIFLNTRSQSYAIRRHYQRALKMVTEQLPNKLRFLQRKYLIPNPDPLLGRKLDSLGRP